MTVDNFEKTLTKISGFIKKETVLPPQTPASRQACANKILDQNSDLLADELKSFLTQPGKQIEKKCSGMEFVGPLRVGVHIFRALAPNDQNLLQIALTPDVPWYVKQEIMFALALPFARFDWKKVETIITDQYPGNEIRNAAMDLMVAHNKSDFLPFLKSLEQNNNDYFTGPNDLKLLTTRTSLGDLELIEPLLHCYKTPPYWSAGKDAEQAWGRLNELAGGPVAIVRRLFLKMNKKPPKRLASVWIQLQEYPDPAVCIWAISQAYDVKEQHELCRNFLSSDDWNIAKAAANWLIEKKTNLDKLSQVARNHKLSLATRSWAAHVLIMLGQPADEIEAENHQGESILSVPWPFEAPDEMREAIVHEYARGMGNNGDIRYRIEALKYKSDLASRREAALERQQELVDALENNGVKVSKVSNAGEFNGQGGGCYSVLTLDPIEDNQNSNIFISDLGRFVARDITSFQTWGDYKDIDCELGEASKQRLELCKKIVIENGFHWLDEDFLKIEVPGLAVNTYWSNEEDGITPMHGFLYDWKS